MPCFTVLVFVTYFRNHLSWNLKFVDYPNQEIVSEKNHADALNTTAKTGLIGVGTPLRTHANKAETICKDITGENNRVLKAETATH